MIDDPAARKHVAGVWGIDPDDLPGKGRSAYELLDALGTETGPSALLVFGSNIIVSAPNATHVTDRLEALDLLVVADMVLSETAAIADVVLPVTQWAEETGTMTNLEGRVILRQRAVSPPTGRALGPRRDRRPGRTTRLADRVRHRPGGDLRRAGPGLRGRQGRLRGDHLRPDPRRARGVLALSDARSRRHAADVPRLLRPRRRSGPLPRGRPPGSGRGARRRLPRPSHDRARARAVPVRRADSSCARSSRHRSLRRAAPDAGRPHRRRRRRAGHDRDPARLDESRPRGW